MAARVRLLLPLLIVLGLAASATRASAQPLFAIETRVGGGVMFGSGRGDTVLRPSRVTLGLLGEVALRSDPWVTAYGEILMEALQTVGMGLRAGARIYPKMPQVRITVGAAAIVVPSTLFGASAAIGYCYRKKKFRTCFDVDTAFYFAGNDLPAKRLATQLQGQLSMAFDAL